jgi:hypothetical protein
MWHDWHALASRGIEASARIVGCQWTRSGGIKHHSRTGYYACTYTYGTSADGAVHEGYFQSALGFEPGQKVPIRYLGDRPSTSTWEGNLERPSAAPLGMMGAGAALLAWLLWGARRKPARA